jgi:Tol biopolymer transport system component
MSLSRVAAGHLGRLCPLAALLVLAQGCGIGGPMPLVALNRQLEQAGSSREPSLGGRWLALISSRDGRDRVLVVDVERGLPQPVPGLNRPDAQPLSVSLDAAGERLALVRQLEGRTELVLYLRSQGSLRLVPINPAGVPRRVHLRADGRQLAVEVSRNGVWQIDLVDLP